MMVFAFGCSNATQTPSSPDIDIEKGVQALSSHSLWGLWQGVIDPSAKTVDFIRMRGAEIHVNVLPFLEPPPMINLTLDSIEWNGNIIDADIGLRHPFLGLTEFTGFDVCGIFISNGSVSGFDDAALVMAGDGETRLLNPDGYSRWWNPAEFPINTGTINGYNDGLLGAPDSFADFSSTLNGFKYYCDDLQANDTLDSLVLASRGMFTAGQKNVRHYTIELGTEGLVFNYAIDASWQFPQGDPPFTAPQDFGPGANRVEAWRIDVTGDNNSLWNDGVDSGGDMNLAIDIYDWFNADLNTVKVESPGNFGMVSSSTATGGGTGYSSYEIEITGATPAEGSIDLLISVECEDIGYGGLLPGEPVTSYFTYSVDVSDQSPLTPGWALAWGGTSLDMSYDTAVDGDGNIYVTGEFRNTVDFDPGTGVESRTCVATVNAFLSKFNPDGEFQWVRTWGDRILWGEGVIADNSGNVYVMGTFMDPTTSGQTDFDPSGATDYHSSKGYYDVFLSKFNSSGDYQWARTWGGSLYESSGTPRVDGSGNIYACGGYQSGVDFDPSTSSSAYHSSNGGNDAFVSKFNPSGDFQWVRVWGGSGWDTAYQCEADSDGTVYVAGRFAGTVDFDPTGGVDNHSATGGDDLFLSKLSATGAYQWARTWEGNTHWNVGSGLTIDDSGNVYFAGQFEDSVDFDPGTGTDWHTSNGDDDAFLSKFSSIGDFIWARTWGGIGSDAGNQVAWDGDENLYVTGYFRDTVDFDPGLVDVDNHTSNGGSDVYLSKFDDTGDFMWALTWGGTGGDNGNGVDACPFGPIYVTGGFNGTVDFDPGPGVLELTSVGTSDVFLSKILPTGSW